MASELELHRVNISFNYVLLLSNWWLLHKTAFQLVGGDHGSLTKNVTDSTYKFRV
jgi:hypothetical protein